MNLPSAGGMANDSFIQVSVVCASENESEEEVKMLSAGDSMHTDSMFAGNHPLQLPSAETSANIQNKMIMIATPRERPIYMKDKFTLFDYFVILFTD